MLGVEFPLSILKSSLGGVACTAIRHHSLYIPSHMSSHMGGVGVFSSLCLPLYTHVHLATTHSQVLVNYTGVTKELTVFTIVYSRPPGYYTQSGTGELHWCYQGVDRVYHCILTSPWLLHTVRYW
jgi:hypothetical protein